MTRTALPLTTGFVNEPPPEEKPYEPLPRHGKLTFEWNRHDDNFQVEAHGPIFPAKDDFAGTLELTRADLFAAITGCLAQWQTSVIELQRRTERGGRDRVFRDRIDLTSESDRELVRQAGLEVARAGHDLFRLVFFKGDDGLQAIGRQLERALRDGASNLVVISDECFVPWRMLYLPPDPETDLLAPDARWEVDGFLGYRHIIEQRTKRRRGVSEQIDSGGEGLKVALAVDRTIDHEEPFVEPIEALLRTYPEIRLEVFEKQVDLRRSLVPPTYPDHLLYFGCHGKVIGDPRQPQQIDSSLTLTDQSPIGRIQIEAWLAGKGLSRNPIVFINACQGGQMSSLFYRSFASTLLEAGAHCLVGSQIDLPTVFATDFAGQFLERFLAGGERIGVLLRELTRDYMGGKNNFLGLIYCHYYGMDTHLKTGSGRSDADRAA